MASKYSYKPLSSPRNTRILFLEPQADRDAPLRCSLEALSLDAPEDDRQHYIALSYVWGAKSGTQPLLCDGQTVLITPNCELALRYLRHPRERICLWIDAIVINQEDLTERAQQVPLMANIYRGASEVVIWLGEGNANTARFLSRMRILHRVMNYRPFKDCLKRLHLRRRKKLFSTLVGTKSVEDMMSPFANDWVTRIWTIQEQAVASHATIMCGSLNFTRETFSAIRRAVLPNLALLGAEPATVLRTSEWWATRDTLMAARKALTHGVKRNGSASTPGQSIILATCTLLSQLGNCSDDRDKVYGFYGLLAGIFQHLPTVNYRTNKDDLYEEYTKAIMQSTETFWPASMPFWPASVSKSPSWVLDLTATDHLDYDIAVQAQNLIHIFDLNSDGLNASCRSTIRLCSWPTAKAGTIALEGTAYARIMASDQIWPGQNTFRSSHVVCLYSWIAFCVDCNRPEHPYQGLDALTSALREMIVATCWTPSSREKLRIQFRSILTWFDEYPSLEPHQCDYVAFAESLYYQFVDNKSRVHFLHSIMMTLKTNILFSTSTGHIGITRGRIEPGDTIALLAGSARPVILRQQGDEWRCIGSAHVQGIMNGEAWPQDAENHAFETFCLV